jgi:ABC-type dipeptide/oligopeptide/nickel transport system permease component
MRMTTYIIRRCILLIPVVIGVMTILFILISSLPDQIQLRDAFGAPPTGRAWVYNPTAPCSDVGQPGNGSCPNPVFQADAAKLGLLGPVPLRWAIYVYHGLTFQWGQVDQGSYVGQNYRWADGMPVIQLLTLLLPYTIELAIFALIIILIIAIPVGNLSAINRNRPIDQAARVMSFSGYAMPAFLLGTLSLMAMVLLIGAWSGSYASHPAWCPAGESLYQEFWGSWPAANCITGAAVKNGGYPLWLAHNAVQSTPTGFPTVDAVLHGNYWLALDTIIRMTLPALVIAFGTVASLLRFVRNSMLEVMNLDYIRTARAKGVPERTVVSRHAGRNSMNVTITVLGLTFAGFIGGFPVIEEVFGLHGVGAILAQAVIPGPDFSLIFGSTLLFTYLVVMANMIVDVMYAYLDPRVRLG